MESPTATSSRSVSAFAVVVGDVGACVAGTELGLVDCALSEGDALPPAPHPAMSGTESRIAAHRYRTISLPLLARFSLGPPHSGSTSMRCRSASENAQPVMTTVAAALVIPAQRLDELARLETANRSSLAVAEPNEATPG